MVVDTFLTGSGGVCKYSGPHLAGWVRPHYVPPVAMQDGWHRSRSLDPLEKNFTCGFQPPLSAASQMFTLNSAPHLHPVSCRRSHRDGAPSIFAVPPRVVTHD